VWNKQDPNYLATIVLDSPRYPARRGIPHGTASQAVGIAVLSLGRVIVLDVRVPAIPVAELQGHQQSVNAIAWAPHSSCHICTAGACHMPLRYSVAALCTAPCAIHRHVALAVLPPAGTIERIRSAYGTYDTIQQPSVQTLGSARRHTL
jgi:hypothetical protein